MPLVINHGWPWTFWDMRKIIGPLSDPAAHGGDPADAFEVIAPSLPGFAFSSPLTTEGMFFNPTADLWVKLMARLGHDRFATQGGDIGSFVSARLGHKYAEQHHRRAPASGRRGDAALPRAGRLCARRARLGGEVRHVHGRGQRLHADPAHPPADHRLCHARQPGGACRMADREAPRLERLPWRCRERCSARTI